MSTESLDLLLNANGVGSSTLEDIRAAGFTSIEEVGECTPGELSNSITGVGYTTAVDILSYLEDEGHRTIDTDQRNREQLVSLLEDLFEFGRDDLDFGVYKLMNQKRERVEQFINEELVQVIEESVQDLEEEMNDVDVEKKRQGLIDSLGEDVFLKDGTIDETYQDAPMVQEYLEAKEQAEAQSSLENTRAEIYNYIYQFFNRYYENGDFITQRHRTQNEPPYSVPYDGSDTHFHWVTKNQYYAKTSEQLTRFSFNHYEYDYQFHTQQTTAGERTIGDSEFFVMESPEDIQVDTESREVKIVFYRRKLEDDDLERCGISTKTRNKQASMNESFSDEIAEKLRTEEVSFSEVGLNEKLTEYTTRNQSDFFIHKDLGGFLKNELEEYVKSEIVCFNPEDGPDGMNDIDLEKGRVVNEVAIEIISFVNQIEEFKRKLFEKRKFVTESYNLIPVSEIPSKWYSDILENNEQLAEWEGLYSLDVGGLSKDDLEHHPYNRMLVDTSLFNAIQLETTSPNTLVKGENHQALSFLEEAYSGSVDAIYIDPPYNTENPSFAYKDSYERSTWLSMMYDRLRGGKRLLQDDGIVFVSIDYNELPRLRLLMDAVYGEKNYQATFVWKRRIGTNLRNDVSIDHEYVLCYGRTDDAQLKGIEKDFERYSNPDDDPRGRWVSADLRTSKTKEEYPDGDYTITDPETGNKFSASESRVWGYSKETMEEFIETDKVLFPDNADGTPRLKKFVKDVGSTRKPTSTWVEGKGVPEDEIRQIEEQLSIQLLQSGKTGDGTKALQNIMGYKAYDYPKPPSLIKSLLEQSTENGDLVLDFFAGSGTTAQAVLELNREREATVNYTLVEMLDEAFEVTQERIQKLMYSEDWNDGEPQLDSDLTIDDCERNEGVSKGIECIELETYEQSLDAVDFTTEQSTLANHTDYLLNYVLEMGTDGSATLVENSAFSTPTEYQLNPGTQDKVSIDLMTTFRYLIGLQEATVRTKEISDVTYTLYEGETAVGETLVVWRHNADAADYKAEQEELNVGGYERIYVNGDSALPGAFPIAPEFEKRMFNGESNNE